MVSLSRPKPPLLPFFFFGGVADERGVLFLIFTNPYRVQYVSPLSDKKFCELTRWLGHMHARTSRTHVIFQGMCGAVWFLSRECGMICVGRFAHSQSTSTSAISWRSPRGEAKYVAVHCCTRSGFGCLTRASARANVPAPPLQKYRGYRGEKESSQPQVLSVRVKTESLRCRLLLKSR